MRHLADSASIDFVCFATKYMARIRCSFLLSFLASLSIITVLLPSPVFSQIDPADRAQEEYLKSLSAADRANAIEQKLLDGLNNTTNSGLAQPEKFAKDYAFALTLHGFSVPTVEKLRDRGLDPLQIAIAGPSASVVERATIAETVVVGEVTSYTYTLEPGDGYRSSIVVRVDDVLKGDVDHSEITIRQRTGSQTNEKHLVDVSTDIEPEAGDRYLFYLSHSMYKFRIQHPELHRLEPQQEDLSTKALDRYYITWGTPQKLMDRKLERIPFEAATQQIFEDIRSISDVFNSTQ